MTREDSAGGRCGSGRRYVTCALDKEVDMMAHARVIHLLAPTLSLIAAGIGLKWLRRAIQLWKEDAAAFSRS